MKTCTTTINLAAHGRTTGPTQDGWLFGHAQEITRVRYLGQRLCGHSRGKGWAKSAIGGADQPSYRQRGTAPGGFDAPWHRGLTGYMIRTARCQCGAQTAPAWPARKRGPRRHRANAAGESLCHAVLPPTAAAAKPGKRVRRGKRWRPCCTAASGVNQLYNADRPMPVWYTGAASVGETAARQAAALRPGSPRQTGTKSEPGGRRRRSTAAGPDATGLRQSRSNERAA